MMDHILIKNNTYEGSQMHNYLSSFQFGCQRPRRCIVHYWNFVNNLFWNFL